MGPIGAVINSFVSTHSRPKAAGSSMRRMAGLAIVSTHSRPKAAGSSFRLCCSFFTCFNTQPPEGGWVVQAVVVAVKIRFQHTAARRRLARFRRPAEKKEEFQHTAARRRLALPARWPDTV